MLDIKGSLKGEGTAKNAFSTKQKSLLDNNSRFLEFRN